MKEIMAIIRMNKVNAMKKALLNAGVAGFTAVKVMGRGRLVKDPSVIEDRKKTLLSINPVQEPGKEKLVTEFLDGTRLFPRRLFTIMAHDEEVPQIVAAIIEANRTENKVGDGKIFVMPVMDVIRVRTAESGDSAL
jgi:nitrogen regulatory protein PII 2